jgi:ADP-ribosylglycohydrolase
MLGAIAGDVIGSVYEGDPVKTPHFHPLFHDACRPTDDTVLTVAVADAILRGADADTVPDGEDFVDKLKEYFLTYPYAGYGGSFIRWASSTRRKPYGSWGNGSAMRVSPVGFAFDTLEEVLEQARRSAEVTHNHAEGVKGAQAVASAIFLARTGKSKEAIKAYVSETFAYNLDRTLDQIRPDYQFEVSCQASVPESIIAFLESDGYEDAVRKAVSLGGDADTMACIAGGIAHAYYGIPDEIQAEVWDRLDDRLRRVTREFMDRYL